MKFDGAEWAVAILIPIYFITGWEHTPEHLRNAHKYPIQISTRRAENGEPAKRFIRMSADLRTIIFERMAMALKDQGKESRVYRARTKKARPTLSTTAGDDEVRAAWKARILAAPELLELDQADLDLLIAQRFHPARIQVGDFYSYW